MRKIELFNTREHLTDDAVYLYVDALKLGRETELSPEVLDHVADCLECKQNIQTIVDLVSEQDYHTRIPHPYFDQKKIYRISSYSTITRLAAAIIIGFGVVFLAYILIPEGDKPIAIEDSTEETTEITVEKMQPIPPDIISPETLPIIPPVPREPADLYAANFEPSPFYENLIHQQFRSPAVRVRTPEPGVDISDTVHFSWESRTPISLLLRIHDNTGAIVWETTTDRGSVTYSDDLDPGIYYWRLESEDELLYVGKFTVPVR
jgi:hypothetical protein